LTLQSGEGKGAVMVANASDTPPDRLSLDPRSEHYDEALLSRGVGIRFNGQEKTNVIEYSVSEGWIRVAAGQVEPYFEKPAQDEGGEGVASDG
jgi:hypothetical protein